MTYRLAIFVDLDLRTVEVERDLVERLKRVRQSLLLGSALEEKLDLLAENYVEYEMCLLEIALRSSTFHDHDSFADGRIVNRRVANLLTTARLYVDQTSSDLGELETPHAQAEFKAALSSEYDSRSGFRIMEALRNHIQHNGLPVHSMSYQRSRDDLSDQSRISAGAIPLFEIRRAVADKSFKKSVLSDLDSMKDSDGYMNLTQPIRDYIEGIWEAHGKLRTLIAPELTAAQDDLSGACKLITDKLGLQASPIDLWAMTPTDSDFRDSDYLSTKFVDRRQDLERKNVRQNIASHYVTSRSVSFRG